MHRASAGARTAQALPPPALFRLPQKASACCCIPGTHVQALPAAVLPAYRSEADVRRTAMPEAPDHNRKTLPGAAAPNSHTHPVLHPPGAACLLYRFRSESAFPPHASAQHIELSVLLPCCRHLICAPAHFFSASYVGSVLSDPPSRSPVPNPYPSAPELRCPAG